MRIKSAAILAALILTACSSGVVPAPRNADYYMNEGNTLFADERYEDAIAAWEKVRERYASPEMNTLAELKIADARFEAEQYIEAAIAYEAFLKQHPEHAKSADVLYRLGISYNQEILSPERDQTTTSNALSAFDTLLKRFPNDPRRAEVEPLMVECRNRLAGHELHIGTFYLRQEYYSAAIARLEPLLTQYPDYSARDELYFLLGKAYLLNEQRELAGTYFNRLYLEYPKSKFVEKAKKLLLNER